MACVSDEDLSELPEAVEGLFWLNLNNLGDGG